MTITMPPSPSHQRPWYRLLTRLVPHRWRRSPPSDSSISEERLLHVGWDRDATEDLCLAPGDRLEGLDLPDRIVRGAAARLRVAQARETCLREGSRRFGGKRLAFLLPVMSAGGGGHVVIQEAAAMRKMGVDAVLVNLERHRVVFEQEHPANPIPCIYLDTPRLDRAMLSQWNAVVATAYNSVAWFAGLPSAAPAPVKAYYIQDFEPLFFPRRSRHYRKAMESYTLGADLVRLTKTSWNARMIQQHVGLDSTIVGPSVDLDLFRPRKRHLAADVNGRLRIAAMIRPSTPRRAARHTMEVLREFCRMNPETAEIILFGCRPGEAEFANLPQDFPWRHAGILTRLQLALLMNEIDVFADFSEFQAMGLTALEAMACGAAVLVPQEGGADSFARDGQNALLVDTHSADACLTALERLVFDRELTARLRGQATEDVCQYAPEFAARRILEALFPDW